VTARLVRPARTLCRSGLMCNQPATYLITAKHGLAVPVWRCLDHLGVAVECIAESLAEDGIEAEITVTPITREG
jgi:hypothetical protein